MSTLSNGGSQEHANGIQQSTPSPALNRPVNGSSPAHINGHVNGLNGQSASHSNGNDHAFTRNGNIEPSNGHLSHEANGSHSNGHITNNISTPGAVPVAVCGMAMRLPGGIRNSQTLFDFLVNKGDARTRTPPSRYNVEAYYNAKGKPGTVTTEYGYFLEDVDLAHFDHSMFTVAAAEAELMDPNQRLTLEVVREALEQAGEDWRGKPIGTYVGMFTEDWQELHHKDSDYFHPYLMMGTLDFALSNRISYEYDLRGPR